MGGITAPDSAVGPLPAWIARVAELLVCFLEGGGLPVDDAVGADTVGGGSIMDDGAVLEDRGGEYGR